MSNSPQATQSQSNWRIRIFNYLKELNKVTIKDAGLPPHIEEFVDEFSGRACYGPGDIMGGYYEKELDVTKRTLPTF
ncbi:hypothetical protein O181_072091 [Austropuccinia psidii MF-1]|uniref:Uncharacterized protein n=1 Tax=Austropuccinia psidii MF-1 TaxID=1389203 RepID=A0A9Q3I739_9BASI|nr:hypothetical protein [Austropuccinia psidii MF-1]